MRGTFKLHDKIIYVSTGRRIPARPDIIVVVRGYYENTRDLVSSGKDIEVLVEYKEDPFNRWENEISSQILPYLHTFGLSTFILASLRRVPEHVKDFLDRKGVIVIDKLRPRSSSVRLLHEIFSSQFSRY